jgi:hypothetical protein
MREACRALGESSGRLFYLLFTETLLNSTSCFSLDYFDTCDVTLPRLRKFSLDVM